MLRITINKLIHFDERYCFYSAVIKTVTLNGCKTLIAIREGEMIGEFIHSAETIKYDVDPNPIFLK